MIKFRAWVKTQKRMIETDHLFDIHYKYEMITVKQDDRDLEGFAFDEIELMQSTGLCDKEGTEVFEGDILHHQIQTEYTFIVKYDKDKGRWYGDGLSRTYRIDITKEFLPYYKVIGNIYENQEILKEKE